MNVEGKCMNTYAKWFGINTNQIGNFYGGRESEGNK